MAHESAQNKNGYDVAEIRKDFPILATEVYGKPLVYLDNAASAQKPRQVIERIRRAYEEEYANVHRGLHYLSSTATLAYEASRGKVQKFLNARSEEEIIFTSGGTDAFNDADQEPMLEVADVYDPDIPVVENEAYVARVL